MREQSSEEIAHRQGRNQMIRKWLTILAPTTVILAIFLIIFVDSRAIVLSFSFVIFGLLLVIFTIGSGNSRKRKVRIYKDYSVKTIRPGSSYSPQHPGAGQSGSSEFQHEPSNTEEYQRMKDAYKNPQIVVVQSKGGDNNSKSQQNKQSQLGAQISNTALVGLMVAAAIVLWLFGGGD